MSEDTPEPEDEDEIPLLERITYRQLIPANIPDCFEIEQASYPKDEAASKSDLQYRQHFAEKYFRCAVLEEEEGDEDTQKIIGFICATRCRVLTEDSMSSHHATGPLLAIHSVVVAQEYRNQGVAIAMMTNYLSTMATMDDGVERYALLAKANLLPYYVKCGFSVLRISNIKHGTEGQWFHLEMSKVSSKIAARDCWVVDAFTETPGRGNPAAVVLVDGLPIDEQREWCQRVAREFNHSETAFVWKIPPGEDDDEEAAVSSLSDFKRMDSTEKFTSSKYGIRYYTANGTEVDLCGHATLGASAVLFQTDPVDRITFCAKYAQLTMAPLKYISGKRMQVCMNFPQKKLTDVSKDRRAIVQMLQRAFPSCKKKFDAGVLHVGVDEDGGDLLVEVTSDLLNDIGYKDIQASELDWTGYDRGVILCCVAPEDSGVDVWSRFFAPKVGIQEDPVTGSAHCTIAPYFCEKLDKTELKAHQRSQRTGTIHCTLLNESNRVTLMGAAVITLTGKTWI